MPVLSALVIDSRQHERGGPFAFQGTDLPRPD